MKPGLLLLKSLSVSLSVVHLLAIILVSIVIRTELLRQVSAIARNLNRFSTHRTAHVSTLDQLDDTQLMEVMATLELTCRVNRLLANGTVFELVNPLKIRIAVLTIISQRKID